jgi:hypothetical protein
MAKKNKPTRCTLRTTEFDVGGERKLGRCGFSRHAVRKREGSETTSRSAMRQSVLSRRYALRRESKASLNDQPQRQEGCLHYAKPAFRYTKQSLLEWLMRSLEMACG